MKISSVMAILSRFCLPTASALTARRCGVPIPASYVLSYRDCAASFGIGIIKSGRWSIKNVLKRGCENAKPADGLLWLAKCAWKTLRLRPKAGNAIHIAWIPGKRWLR